MAKNNQAISQDEKYKLQDTEIRETLSHIKHKILVMIGGRTAGQSEAGSTS
jgi:hypothetical protein